MTALHLVDHDRAAVAALRDAFAPFPEVSVSQGNVLSVATDAVVSPANSSGFMDGGIDRAYLEFFGLAIQTLVQDAILQRSNGLLPVGAALVVPTGDARLPYLIVAPTTVSPGSIPAEHCYRAMRAVLRVASSDPRIADIYCPSLGTGVGGVAPLDAALEMASAYSDWRASRSATQ